MSDYTAKRCALAERQLRILSAGMRRMIEEAEPPQEGQRPQIASADVLRECKVALNEATLHLTTWGDEEGPQVEASAEIEWAALQTEIRGGLPRVRTR